MYDEGNFNYLNEVSLIKQSSGQDIVDDLVKMYSTSDNMSNKPKPATSNSQVTKSNGKIILLLAIYIFFKGFNFIILVIITFDL